MSPYRLHYARHFPRKQGEADMPLSLSIPRLTGKGDRISGGRGTKKGRCTKFQLRATAPSDLREFVETVAVFVDDLRHHPFPINIGMQTVGGELWI